jgi:hypothetical protein
VIMKQARYRDDHGPPDPACSRCRLRLCSAASEA